MTIIHQWTIKLAEAAVPEEVYLANSFADVFYTNMQNKQSLEAVSGDRAKPNSTCEPCTAHLLLPTIIHGVTASAHHLMSLLMSDEVHNFIELPILLTEVADFGSKTIFHKRQSDRKRPETENASSLTKTVVDILASELEKEGIGAQVAKKVALRTVMALMADSEEALIFLKALLK